MGQIEENNAFLLGMASKGVIRVREVVEKGGGAVLAYEEIGEVVGYELVRGMLAGFTAVEEVVGYSLVGAAVAAYEEVEG